MEIKIVCACGTKFKFDVNPVNARMPAPVSCPTCGKDATEQANAAIQSTLSPPAPEESAGDSITQSPGGLRINRPSAPPPEAPVGATGGEAELRVPRPRPLPKKAKTKNPIVNGVTTVLVIACIVFGAWRVGSKWYKRLSLVGQIASAAGGAGVDSSESSGAKNLWYEKCAVLFIKHTNHLEVAEMCKDYWKGTLHKNLSLIDTNTEYMHPGEYELIPAHNGYVRIVGAFEWPLPQFEGLAQHLSQNFGTLVFEWRSESFADTYHFGVYDQGTRKFHAQMDVKIKGDDVQEIVTTEGNEFAIANGYKPGSEGFKDFHVLEADKITQRLGMKLWDEKEGTEIKAMLLKENGTATP